MHLTFDFVCDRNSYTDDLFLRERSMYFVYRKPRGDRYSNFVRHISRHDTTTAIDWSTSVRFLSISPSLFYYPNVVKATNLLA